MMDIDQQTVEALDWPTVLQALSEQARTAMGAREVLTLRDLGSVAEIRRTLDAVEELQLMEEEGAYVPLGDVPDVTEALAKADKGAILDKDALRQVGVALQAMQMINWRLVDSDKEIPVWQSRAEELEVHDGVRTALTEAFDDLGELSERTYPELGELRQRINGLHTRIRRTLDELVSGDELRDALQDQFITQRGERYVLPIKANFKRKDMGIVHDMSGSGQTAFIEPHQVVALNNALRIAEGELQATERRILAKLSNMVGRVAPKAVRALDAITWMDTIAARTGLAFKMQARRPEVRDGAIVHIVAGRHPILTLREVPVVANDIDLTDAQPVLVVSGPNTGGKTVALKTVGLFALMARCGLFVPADEGTRIDRFQDVVALIGDQQTVMEDHSSFSSHLLALRHMTERAAPGCLYLVDEIASGTDPQQGAALAHALLERWLEAGPRCFITTHFHRLKTLSATDDRFAIAGMQFADGKPTYRLVMGASGESHALSIAERIGLGDELVERARALMEEGERRLSDVLAKLDEEKGKAEEAARDLKQVKRDLAAQQRRLEKKEETLTRKARQIEEERAQAFVQRLNKAEKAVREVVRDLQRQPSHKKVEAAKATLAALREIQPNKPVPKPVKGGEVPTEVEPGQTVKLRKLGGRKATVISVSGNQVTVQAGAIQTKVKLKDLETVAQNAPTAKAWKPKKTSSHSSTPAAPRRTPLEDAMRHQGNTLDLRGKRVDEGIDAVEHFLDQLIMRGQDIGFILHGHGTGAMKQAVRQWLKSSPHVDRYIPANADQGGDAYTVVGVK